MYFSIVFDLYLMKPIYWAKVMRRAFQSAVKSFVRVDLFTV